jgi:3-deoxy-D-manno-octulosonic acid kinase
MRQMMASPVAPLRATADVCRAPTSGGAMLYDASRAGNASADLFRVDWWRTRASVEATQAGRGRAVFIESPQHSWVLRHYARGGSVAKILGDRYLWTGEVRTRPFREWRLLHDLHAAGFPVPAPVAAQYQRAGAFYRGDLVTERIPGGRPLSALLAEPSGVPADAWRSLGACVRRFHDAGVFHADLNAHNLLLDAEGRVYLLDFDRGERRAPGRWREANVARLRRSLDRIQRSSGARFSEDQWRMFLEAYTAAPRG